MGASVLLEPFRRVREAVIRFAVRLLTKPLKRYTLVYPNDLAELKRQIRKGDVILVEGNERISEVIKYLTQSSWSHSALYVGDEAIKRDPELTPQARPGIWRGSQLHGGRGVGGERRRADAAGQVPRLQHPHLPPVPALRVRPRGGDG